MVQPVEAYVARIKRPLFDPKTLSPYQFGEELLAYDDLDPVYNILWHGRQQGLMDEATLKRWLVAYWGFYHAGTASYLAQYEGEEFWLEYSEAASTKVFPRGRERRHYRGNISKDSAAGLMELELPPETLVDSLCLDLDTDYSVLAAEVVREWPGFGKWIAFKIGDMLERLDLFPTKFLPHHIFTFFESPKIGAMLLAYSEGWEASNSYPTPEQYAIARLTNYLGEYPAPPREERVLGLQEYETVLCKWKSYLNGHYEPGHDVADLKKALLRFDRIPLSFSLYRLGIDLDLWTGNRS